MVQLSSQSFYAAKSGGKSPSTDVHELLNPSAIDLDSLLDRLVSFALQWQ